MQLGIISIIKHRKIIQPTIEKGMYMKKIRLLLIAAVMVITLPLIKSDVHNEIYADTAEEIRDKA